MTTANEYPRGDQTRLEYLEKPVSPDEVPQSPPAPETPATVESDYDQINKRVDRYGGKA